MPMPQEKDDDEDFLEEDESASAPATTAAAAAAATTVAAAVAAATAKADAETAKLRARIAQRERELSEALRRGAACEEKLRRHADADAAQTRVFDRLMAQVEANLAAATARAARAEQRCAELETALAAERARVAELEGAGAPSAADFPDWPAARRCIVAQRAQMAQARAKAREASELLRGVSDSAATHLVALAHEAHRLQAAALAMLSYDRVFDADDGTEALPPL